MAAIGYVHMDNIIQDWAEDTGLIDFGELDETLLVKWATDAINMIPLPDNGAHKISIIYVENYKAKMPEDFLWLQAAAANVYKKKEKCKPTKRQQIIQWVQGTGDCKLEVNLVCDKCKKPECTCEYTSVAVDVDRIWEQSQPQIYYQNYMKLGRVGYGNQPFYDPDTGQLIEYPDRIEQKFQLMKYQSNDYFRLGHFLGDCPNVNCKDCVNQFRIDMPYIEVDFPTGEILLSYVGKKTDENGNLMVPDHPDMIDAILNHITYKWMSREANRNINNPNKSSQAYKAFAREAKTEREDSFGKFRTYVTIPDIHDFQSWLENSWLKRIPNHHRKDQLNRPSRDQYQRYNDMLDDRSSDTKHLY